MLEVKQVSKLYENQRGVRDIDFSMSRGEIVGFLGPNGAGKTTTMRMITGYLNPSRGSIAIDGLSMADHPKKARQKKSVICRRRRRFTRKCPCCRI